MSLPPPTRSAYPDKPNPNDGYRRHGIADLAAAQLRLDALRARRILSAQQAKDAADSDRETLKTLAAQSTLPPSDSGHMSPWELARSMWGSA